MVSGWLARQKDVGTARLPWSRLNPSQTRGGCSRGLFCRCVLLPRCSRMRKIQIVMEANNPDSRSIRRGREDAVKVRRPCFMSRAVLTLCAATALAACRAPVGVVRLNLPEVHEQLKGDVLTTGRPSTASRTELQRRGLAERYAHDPATVLAELHAVLLAHPHDADLLFALSEMSFDHALPGGDREYYLATVVYAWAYLFGAGAADRLDVFDPRGRLW